MFYLNLNSRLTITNIATNEVLQLPNIASADIRQSVKQLGDTAVVTIPRRYRQLTENDIFTYIKVGHKATLELGYNGELFTEFEGYVSDIQSGYPIKLTLADDFFLLKKTSYKKTFRNVKLKQLLEFIAPSYTITCDDIDIGTEIINNESAYTVLERISRSYLLYTFIKNNELVCGFYTTVRGMGKEYIYDFSKNVRANETNLKYRRKEDIKLRIKAVSKLDNGNAIVEYIGSQEEDAAVRTIHFRNKDRETLKRLATEQYEQLAFDGLEGTITGFGYPRIQAGDTLTIVDPKNTERNGKYFVESMTISYANVYKRTCRLSFKVE